MTLFITAKRLTPGLIFVASLAALSIWLSEATAIKNWRISALTIAIAGGILLGNTVFPRVEHRFGDGADYAKTTLLRLGIVLYGFQITFQQIGMVGWSGILINLLVITLTFSLAIQFGGRVLGLDRKTAILIGAGSSICGAAAILAAEPIVRGRMEKVSVAVATVVIFGTLAMVIYPLAYPYLGMSEHAFGMFVGSTVHEVAQVVGAGRAVSEDAAAMAVIQKMMRVMMLAPFLILLETHLGSAETGPRTERRITIPWFAVLFIAVSGFHSMDLLPREMVAWIVRLDTYLLAMAMGALGLRIHRSAFRQAGAKPLLLGATLFVFLVAGGYVINRVVGIILPTR